MDSAIPRGESAEQPATAAVIGGGPGGLIAAEVLAAHGLRVVVFEQMPSVGRKLLVAGRGGLNLTHSEPLEDLLRRYEYSGHEYTDRPDQPSISEAIREFPPAALRSWSAGLGHETFVGSSGRVFPKALRANGLLASWLDRLEGLGVEIRTRTRFDGWDLANDGTLEPADPPRQKGSRLRFHSDTAGTYLFDADVTVMSLGGASWPRVGSDGAWQQTLRNRGVKIAELNASNCGFNLSWSKVFRERFEGSPVKNIAVTAKPGTAQAPLGELSAHGEFMVVESGVEGGVIYAVGSRLRDQLSDGDSAELTIDLLPDLELASIIQRLEKRRPKESTSTALKRMLGLEAVKIGLLNEVALAGDSSGLPRESRELAALIKALPLALTGSEGLERAISSAGGILLTELDQSFMLKAIPSTFCAGEMLDWDAPTGGYLLQATFATGVAAANGALRWLSSRSQLGNTTQ
ncbi:MAG TPA: TIGR03862 family flavoprotein [Microthrixaceae bacterium]|nr:TIGR03862 family flavoprotein [Microthrixaceae bacterium]